MRTPKPPQRKLQRWRLPPFNARVETVTTKPFFREPFTPNGGLVVQSGARSLRHRDAIISLAARYKLPAVYSARDYASAGGSYVDRILKSEMPADLPVQLSVKYETVLNMTTAKALGLDVPTSILLSADEPIE